MGPEQSCPLCGYSWQDAEELKARFNVQADQLEQLIKVSGTELNAVVEEFTNNYLVPLRKFLNDYLSKNPIDESFVKKLKEADSSKAKLETLYQQFSSFDIDLKEFLNYEISISGQINLEDLRAAVNGKRYTVDSNKLCHYFPSLFLEVFDESFDNVALVTKSDVANKRKYIEWQYSLYQSEVAKTLQKEYDKQKKQFENAKALKEKFYRLTKVYEKSLQDYQKSLIENIEILFHIYSGRITQEGQGNLGLFINLDKNGIRFLENHSKRHDAVFTMSSGQLAALMISFTLALNKRYSKNKLLFIDDPIQTLDELNIAGFIELLRNEFSDRQIFISTHEDMMSAYMRYKFEKFGLGVERLSFKDRMLTIGV